MTDGFIDVLLGEVRAGYGFIPLVGSGLSAPSGIPVGPEFGDYIFYCLNSIVAGAAWNPDDPTWPKLEKADATQITRDRKQAIAQEWLKEWLDQRKTYQNGAILEAVGSLADWRASLIFLSRLPRQKGTKKVKNATARFFQRLTLTAPNNTVVDSAFIHVTNSRQPTLAHMMLAHCADALRIQTLLTTNFDTLIEEAFQRQGVYLTTFDVHHHAGLPTPQLVLAQRAIVKLHGGRYGLRADYTLDEDPSAADERTFADYFATGGAGSDPRVCRKHLLIMGVSGYDSRTMKLIKAAASKYPTLKLFWVFHRPPGEQVKEFAAKLGIPRSRFCWTVQPDLGLMLLNLYQSQFASLPPSGADFATQTIFPPENYPRQRYDERQRSENVQKLTDIVTRAKASRSERERKHFKKDPSLIVVRGGRGVSSVASQVYDRLRRDYNTVWLELDQHSDVTDFLIALADAVVQRLGAAMVTPPVSQTTVDTCVDCLVQLVSTTRRPFVVFANGRDGPGSGIDWQGNPWGKKVEKEFWDTAQRLVRELDGNLRFVALTGNGGLKRPRGDGWTKVKLKRCLHLNAKKVFNSIKQDPPGTWGWVKQRFVFALTLFRKSRYPAALTTWGLIKASKRLSDSEDNDEYRAKECEKFIAELCRHGAVRLQPGGMIWMHADIRDRLQKLLLKQVKKLRKEEATCHQGIADWYVKLFRSSNDPHAALESIYHRIRCAETAERSSPKGAEHFGVRDLEITSILEAVETLELARDRILACARSTSASFMLKKVMKKVTVAAKSDSVFGRHRDACSHLALICEDLQCDFARTRGEKFRERRWKEKRPLQKVPRKLRRRAMLRQDADGLLHRRRYGECEKKLEYLFKKLELPLSIRSAPGDNSELVAKMRKRAKKWCLKPGRSENEMRLMVRALRCYMFLQMLISQAHGWLQAPRETLSDLDADEVYKRLRFGESIYTLATSVTRYVSDHDFLQVENTYLRTHYGVMLAELSRFQEAHRRLNEATGYLSQSSKTTDGLAWAIIDLRRAETYLFQAKRATLGALSEFGCSEQTKHFTEHDDAPEDRQRIAGAFLDDMRYALVRARNRFINSRKDVWWWTLLLELELAYFCERGRQRSNQEIGKLLPREFAECEDIVKNALLVVHTDGVRLARILNLLTSVGCYKSGVRKKSRRRKMARLGRLGNKVLDRLKEIPRIVDAQAKSRQTGDLEAYIQSAIKSFEKGTPPRC